MEAEIQKVEMDLVFYATVLEFPIEYLEKIEKECLEIEVDSPEKAIVNLSNLEIKNMVVMQGKKSQWKLFLMEEHNVTMHGFLMNIEEF